MARHGIAIHADPLALAKLFLYLIIWIGSCGRGRHHAKNTKTIYTPITGIGSGIGGLAKPLTMGRGTIVFQSRLTIPGNLKTVFLK